MRVKDIMKKKYVSLQADDSLERILEVFSEKHVTSAPVFDKGEFLGIASHTEIAKYFVPKDMDFQLKETAKDGGEASIVASSIARKPPYLLTPDQPLKLVIGRIISTSDCIPVMEGKEVIGLVSPSDLVEFFLAEIAKKEAYRGKGSPKKAGEEEETSTAIDQMLLIVRRDGQTTPKKVAAELGISVKTSEDLAKLLSKHRLLDVNYSFVTGMVLRRVDHGKK